MKALTVHQPYAFLIAERDKLVENRTWRPHSSVMNRYIAIHGGKKYDHEAAGEARNRGVFTPTALESGIYCAALLGGIFFAYGTERNCRWTYYVFDEKQGQWKETKLPPEFDSPPVRNHLIGPFAWHFTDVIKLDQVIPCAGQQGLWNLTADVKRRVPKR